MSISKVFHQLFGGCVTKGTVTFLQHLQLKVLRIEKLKRVT